MEQRLIITAASPAFATSLLAFLGSLDVNWPGHPRVLVYDLGLEGATLETLRGHGVEVRKVPAFCEHWRKHFVWKIWCWNDAPARYVYWLDSGTTVLGKMEEAFTTAEKLGYFVTPSGHALSTEASPAAHAACGVDLAFSKGRGTLQAGIFAFDKEELLKDVIEEALRLALVEDNIRSYSSEHRHDQAILSLLLYRKFGAVLAADQGTYAGSTEGELGEGQKLWVHRRTLHPRDAAYFAERIGKGGGERFVPRQHAIEAAKWHKRLRKYLKERRRALKQALGLQREKKPFDGVRDK